MHEKQADQLELPQALTQPPLPTEQHVDMRQIRGTPNMGGVLLVSMQASL